MCHPMLVRGGWEVVDAVKMESVDVGFCDKSRSWWRGGIRKVVSAHKEEHK